MGFIKRAMAFGRFGWASVAATAFAPLAVASGEAEQVNFAATYRCAVIARLEALYRAYGARPSSTISLNAARGPKNLRLRTCIPSS